MTGITDLSPHLNAVQDVLSELEKGPISLDRWYELINEYDLAVVCQLGGQRLADLGDVPGTVVITPLGQEFLARIKAAE